MFQQRRIGRTDLQVGVLGLGGAPLGDLYERIPPDRALATLEAAYRRGIRLFDISLGPAALPDRNFQCACD